MSPFLIFLSCAVGAAPAANEKVSLENLDKKFVSVNLFDLDPLKAPPHKGGLMELKWKELRGEWLGCQNLAEKLQKKSGDLEPWVARTHLECALKANEVKKNALAITTAFQAVRPTDLRQGPWRDSLREAWFKAGLEAAKSESKKTVAQSYLEVLSEQQDLLSKDQRAALALVWGDLVKATDPEQALFYWKQSQDLKSDSATASRISEAEKARPAFPKPTVATNLIFGGTETEIGAEAQADKEIASLLSQGKRTEAAKKMVELLNRFPNGRFAKRDRERLPQYLISAWEKGEEAEASTFREILSNADALRVGEWAAQLHRRGEDLGAAQLAEKALEVLPNSASASTWLWILGRASLFRGETEKALTAFNKLVQFHSTTDEASEALFRLALIHLRAGHEVLAAKFFEKLISQEKPRWDLSARYWRIRALEKNDKARSDLERDELIRLSPFTYYGLKLRAERENGVLEFPKTDRSPLEIAKSFTWFSGSQKKTWARFKRLSAEGWLLEAQAELASLPAPTQNWALIEWARVLAKAGQYPASIQFTARAMDAEETLRHPRYIEVTYPRAYSRFIDVEAKKYNLDPVLVRSLIRQESAFGLKAVSTSNAMGLMQLIPPTAREVSDEIKLKATIPDDLFRPEINVPMGTYYIAKMLRQFGGTVPFALAAYNAGPTKVNQWVRARPELEQLRGKVFENWRDEIWYDELPWAETSFYVKAILRNILIDRLIDQGRVSVGPGFWSELRLSAAGNPPEETKQR